MIMIGDGVLQFLYKSGLLKFCGLNFVYEHKFAHHVQLRLNHAYPDSGHNCNDGNLRGGLMACQGVLPCAQRKGGGGVTGNQIGMFDDAAHATGDCKKGGVGGGAVARDHHGMPYQRRCATPLHLLFT